MKGDLVDFDGLISSAISAGRQGDGVLAVSHLQEAIRQCPGAAEPLLLLGAELAMQNNVEAAEDAFTKAVSLAPALHLARFQLGLLQLTTDRLQAATKTWDPLLSLPDSYYWPSVVCGYLMLQAGATAEAILVLEAAADAIGDNAALAMDVRETVRSARALLASRSGDSSTVERSTPDPSPHQAGHVLLGGYLNQRSI